MILDFRSQLRKMICTKDLCYLIAKQRTDRNNSFKTLYEDTRSDVNFDIITLQTFTKYNGAFNLDQV